MAKAVFTTKVEPTYDDLPEFRYHFPRSYLRQAEAAVGDWAVYYEPRRLKTFARSLNLSLRGAYFDGLSMRAPRQSRLAAGLDCSRLREARFGGRRKVARGSQ